MRPDDDKRSRDAASPVSKEDYMHDYDGALTKQIVAGRTAETHGAFILPHLRAGMTLLDCGCGPGTITAGLARKTAPGHVTGVDREDSQLELARAHAAELGLANVSFENTDAYDLPYEDSRFDAVFSHAMLEHMTDPLAILKEMRRVLKPGGLVGIRCVDLAATLITPEEPALAKAHDIWCKHRIRCGGDPYLGRRLRALLREAGFARTIGSASSETWATPELTRSMMSVLKAEFTGPKISGTAIEMGWADQAQMDETTRALEEWGSHPDAFMAIVWCEGTGWKE